jgi:hypothetical protein
MRSASLVLFVSLALIGFVHSADKNPIVGVWSKPTGLAGQSLQCCVPESFTIEESSSTTATVKYGSPVSGYEKACKNFLGSASSLTVTKFGDEKGEVGYTSGATLDGHIIFPTIFATSQGKMVVGNNDPSGCVIIMTERKDLSNTLLIVVIVLIALVIIAGGVFMLHKKGKITIPGVGGQNNTSLNANLNA